MGIPATAHGPTPSPLTGPLPRVPDPLRVHPPGKFVRRSPAIKACLRPGETRPWWAKQGERQPPTAICPFAGHFLCGPLSLQQSRKLFSVIIFRAALGSPCPISQHINTLPILLSHRPGFVLMSGRSLEKASREI